MRYAIHLFEFASGLNVNLSKSTISSFNCDVQRTNFVAAKWGISIQFLSIYYLGVPLRGNPPSRNFWADVIDKMHKKINNWKYSSLSKGDKITLINSTLASISNYHSSIFKAPISVYKNIEKT